MGDLKIQCKKLKTKQKLKIRDFHHFTLHRNSKFQTVITEKEFKTPYSSVLLKYKSGLSDNLTMNELFVNKNKVFVILTSSNYYKLYYYTTT